jgi:hypothetical protein
MSYYNQSLNNTNCSGEKDCGQVSSSNKPEYVSGIRILLDIFGNSSLLTFLVAFLFAIPLSFLWDQVDYCENQLLGICSDILTLYSCVLGLVITGFSIILLLNKETITKLSDPYQKQKCWYRYFLNTKSNPYDMLCSSFSVSFLFLLVTIIAIILYKNQPNLSSAPWWQFMLIKVLSIMSAIFVVDLLFHLYEVGANVNEKHNKV